ncbi:MAG: universal stress protein [Burkholderiales bacterium]|nr:universal stress protein [Burkholderiales bacterium]MCC7115823.1 universal stress protein [Burkholderiales bacterium]
MVKSLYVPLDNSAHSLAGVDLAITIARASGAALAGGHVYAAKLHDRRFRQMEGGLPAPYQKEAKLVEQREIHDDLITRGLQVISDSYLDVFDARCRAAGLEARRVHLEGRNWQRLVEDIGASDCDLVVIGALGLGAVPCTQIGSVCERVARRVDRDVLVVRETEPRADGAIVVGLDGSPASWGALQTAFDLAPILGRPVEAVAVFDPHFHYVAFNSIAKVLSTEAAKVFRFEEQEKLHEEIIDSGLAKIYQGHLDVAARLAKERGIALGTTLLAGKSFEKLLQYARDSRAWLMAVGRTGVHSDAGMDLGSATENLLRQASCNLLLSARTFEPPAEHVAEVTMAWTDEAERRIARVPDFARPMARKAVVRHAAALGHTIVTSDVIDTLMATIPAGAVDRYAAKRGLDAGSLQGAGGRCPFAPRADAPTEAAWTPEALERLGRIRPESVRDHARLRIEKAARRAGVGLIDAAAVEDAERAVQATLG